MKSYDCIVVMYIQCFIASYYFMCVSISTSYWKTDDVIHEGIWKECSYDTNMSTSIQNETSFFNGTCCSSKEFKGYIGATGFFFLTMMSLEIILIVLASLFKCLRSSKVVIGYAVASLVCMVMVLAVYGAKNDDPTTLGWSYFLALGCFVFRTLFNIGSLILLDRCDEDS